MGGLSAANAAQKAAEETGKQQLKLLATIADNVEATDVHLQKAMLNLSNSVANSLDTLSKSNSQALENLAFTTKSGLDNMASQVGGLKGSVNAVEGAVNNVKGAVDGTTSAVYNTNQAGRLDALIGAISSFGGK